MSDRIAVMFEGSIAQMSDPETLYRRPATRQVAAFIGKMNFLDADVRTEGNRIVVDVQGLGRAGVEPDQAPGGVPQGRSVVGIRPETLGILFPGETTDRRLAPGVVDEVVYYGDMTYYDVRIDGVAEPVTISNKNFIGEPVLDVGTPTQVIWDERSLVLLNG